VFVGIIRSSVEKLAEEGSDAGEGIERKEHETKRREGARQMCTEV